MKYSLKMEELLLFILGVYLFTLSDYRWYWLPLLILVPDLSMIGYVFNNKIGAYIYNFFHHRALAIVLTLSGLYLASNELILIGAILFTHIALDRVFGYGLKFTDGFKNTHLNSAS